LAFDDACLSKREKKIVMGNKREEKVEEKAEKKIV